MDFDYLFYEDLPKGIKSIYIQGKRMSIEEFKKAKKDFLLKRKGKIIPEQILKK
mgnify:CR=1 FL=1|tara:strand:+ start:5954 stop:6115 length:162 start_codon:yes stop_codon:yes gene_type:complete